MTHLHFTSASFIVAAHSYLLGTVSDPTDDMMDHAGSFAMWLKGQHRRPAHVYDWADAYKRFTLEG